MKIEETKKEIEELVKQWKELKEALVCNDYKESNNLYLFISKYDLWYSKALNVVKNILPDRKEDFILLYKNDKRKDLNASNYTIFDALKGVTRGGTIYPAIAITNLIQQKSILKACLEKFDTKIYNIQAVLQADIFDSELDSARYLLKNGFLRASGAICGVILEKHLSKVCDDNKIKISKKEPTLSTYNDALKDNVYDTMEWRRMQRLGDLRNLCDHDKKKEPTKEEVEELILGTDRVIKTIF